MTEPNVSTEVKCQSPLRGKLWIVLIVIIAVVAIMFLQAFHKAWARMLRLDCESNLRQIGLDCRVYAAEHDGHFPSTWLDLKSVGEEANLARCLRCPQTGHEVGTWEHVDLWADYRLLPGRSTNDPSDRILALEPLNNHGSAGANVLFVDGSTQWWPQARLLGTNFSR